MKKEPAPKDDSIDNEIEKIVDDLFTAVDALALAKIKDAISKIKERFLPDDSKGNNSEG